MTMTDHGRAEEWVDELVAGPTATGGPGPGSATTTDLPALCEAAARLSGSLGRPLHRLSLRAGDVALELEFAPAPETAPAPDRVGRSLPAGVQAEFEPESGPEVAAEGVRSPLVGTFYAAPEPGSAPFVRPGDYVKAGQPIGIVEAMKLMNPVPAPMSGRVLDVLVLDGAQVEYDQLLVVLEFGEAS